MGARIERIASESQSHGYQISDDMNQVIASRYAEMANSAEFRDLGAPSLTNVTPSPHQREVRNMIVSRVLEQYAANGALLVEAMIKDPSAMMGGVQGPGPIVVPESLPSKGSAHRGHGGSTGGRTDHSAPGYETARGAITRGASELNKEKTAVSTKLDEDVAGRATEEAKSKRDVE